MALASIYANAALVLAAASSPNSHAGLFRTSRTTTKLLPDQKGGDLGFSDVDELMTRELPDPDSSRYDMIQQDSNGGGVLSLFQRAWAFQERLLAN